MRLRALVVDRASAGSEDETRYYLLLFREDDGYYGPAARDILTALEDHVAVIDEDHRRGVVLCRLEDAMNHAVEVARARNKGAVDQEELALQSMCQGPANGCLAGAGRTDQQHAAFRLEFEFRTTKDCFAMKRRRFVQLAAAGAVGGGLFREKPAFGTAVAGQLDRFGGWKDKRFDATGFFRTEHDGRRA